MFPKRLEPSRKDATFATANGHPPDLHRCVSPDSRYGKKYLMGRGKSLGRTLAPAKPLAKSADSRLLDDLGGERLSQRRNSLFHQSHTAKQQRDIKAISG